jgi:Amidase
MARWETEGDGPRLAVKDCIDVAGSVTTVGCPVIAERAVPAAQDAKVVASARIVGARIVGKTNLTELCWSAKGINPWSGTPVNPAAPHRVPGGSSSGSAVAVANNEADVALGTDTGGSVRIPAACCGVTGLKTTWGRVPVDGLYPLAPSLDTVGWLGKDLAAIELGMRLIEPGFTVQQMAGPPTAGRLRPEGFTVAPRSTRRLTQPCPLPVSPSRPRARWTSPQPSVPPTRSSTTRATAPTSTCCPTSAGSATTTSATCARPRRSEATSSRWRSGCSGPTATNSTRCSPITVSSSYRS